MQTCVQTHREAHADAHSLGAEGKMKRKTANALDTSDALV